MARVNTQVEVRKGKNPKRPLVPVVIGKVFRKLQAGSSEQNGNQVHLAVQNRKTKNRHSTMCGVIAVHPLGNFSARRGRNTAATQSKAWSSMSIKNALRMMCSKKDLPLSKWDLMSIHDFNPEVVIVQGFKTTIRKTWK